MKLKAEHYLDAARMRSTTARKLYNSGRYSAAIYMAGVTVECILRAYIVRTDPEFDDRHDLTRLFKTSQIEYFIHPKHRRKVNAWLGEVWSRWKNNYRFASDDYLRTVFKKLRFHKGIQGDFLKENSRICVEAALQLFTIGERRWESKINLQQL